MNVIPLIVLIVLVITSVVTILLLYTARKSDWENAETLLCNIKIFQGFITHYRVFGILGGFLDRLECFLFIVPVMYLTKDAEQICHQRNEVYILLSIYWLC